jgi:hypothetical protein
LEIILGWENLGWENLGLENKVGKIRLEKLGSEN